MHCSDRWTPQTLFFYTLLPHTSLLKKTAVLPQQENRILFPKTNAATPKMCHQTHQDNVVVPKISNFINKCHPCNIPTS